MEQQEEENHPILKDTIPLQTKVQPRVLSIVNHKGGVGKTTTAINLASSYAALGLRVLLIDMDPQSNSGAGLGIRRAEVIRGTYDLLVNRIPVSELVRETQVPGLDFIPASIELAGTDLELAGAERPQHRLRDVLSVGTDEYDVVIADCPPSFGMLVMNALVASSRLLVPVLPESFALEGLEQILWTIKKIRETENPDLKYGILLTLFDEREELCKNIAREIRGQFGDHVFATMIGREEKVSRASFLGEPVVTLHPDCEGAKSYVQLAIETLHRDELAVRGESSGGWSDGSHPPLTQRRHKNLDEAIADYGPFAFETLQLWQKVREDDPKAEREPASRPTEGPDSQYEDLPDDQDFDTDRRFSRGDILMPDSPMALPLKLAALLGVISAVVSGLIAFAFLE